MSRNSMNNDSSANKFAALPFGNSTNQFASLGVASNSFRVGDNFNAEGGATYPVEPKEYAATWRFSPPYPLLYNMIRLGVVELFATMFFGTAIMSAQAMEFPQEGVSLIKAASLFFVTYTFWHWGKAHVNPAVTLVSCCLGLSTWWELVVRLVTGALGMLAACGISWGFIRADGGVGLTGYNQGYGIQFGWEIFFSMMTYAALFWPIVTCRLRCEMATRWLQKNNWDNARVKSYFDKHIKPHLEESKKSHGNADHAISLNYALWYGALSYIGSSVNGGVYNIWLWFPRAFDTHVAGQQLGMEFVLYFFAPLIGGLLLALVLSAFIVGTRSDIIHMFDSEHIEKWDRDMDNYHNIQQMI